MAVLDCGKPRLGFLGVGWIGKHRMEAIARAEVAEIAAIADACPHIAEQARLVAPSAVVRHSLDELLDMGLDGVVIATPSAFHAEQAVKVLESGCAVFCQKPLARDLQETTRVVEAAKQANLLLSVDFSYRYTTGMQKIRHLVQSGELGDIYAVDLVFHNAYGPDKAWFYDPTLSGGGCVMDLGIHLIDLALWLFDFPQVSCSSSRLFSEGHEIPRINGKVEDFALAEFTLGAGRAARLACSWKLPAGRDAVIEASVYGTQGGATFRNVDGSFYDFVAERFHGTSRELLAAPPDLWGGRAAVAWAERLSVDRRYDPEAERLVQVAAALDAVYGR
ncbi:MAG TPA: Gfo/Idh/MocA family oxidoreductase [Verrucomicrobiae bacterium]|nr:Gfo/Idh/MocA family oxidoreductase [Verrucomicrobiae bacterium]